jgi:hypothetical protein
MEPFSSVQPQDKIMRFPPDQTPDSSNIVRQTLRQTRHTFDILVFAPCLTIGLLGVQQFEYVLFV